MIENPGDRKNELTPFLRSAIDWGAQWFAWFGRLRRVRQASQLLSLLLFVFLALGATTPSSTVLPVDLFFRLDPLANLAVALSARNLPAYALWALPTVLATVLLGRVFCGWICPLGTTLDVFRLGRTGHRRDHPRLRSVKQLLLALILVGSIFGVLTLTVLDPLTIAMRTLVVSLLPSLNIAITALFQQLFQAGIVPELVVSIDQILRPTVLPYAQLSYQMGLLFLLTLGLIVGLNAVAPRFWCRYVCPLGALLGLIGRAAFLKRQVTSDCTSCGRCARHCRMAAIDPESYRADAAECVQCFTCTDECQARALRPAIAPTRPTYDPSRRRLMAGLGLGLLGIVGLRADAGAGDTHPRSIRPPGATPDFLSRCIRCGMCIKACPTGALQPSLVENGAEGFWTPVLVPRLGYCEWSCNNCGQVCPTQAIAPLTLDQKRWMTLGSAYVDQTRCLAWADDIDCIICEEVCPLPDKAVVLDIATVEGGQGAREIKRPRVVRARCIGCGLCEYRCPVPRQAAIRVYALRP